MTPIRPRRQPPLPRSPGGVGQQVSRGAFFLPRPLLRRRPTGYVGGLLCNRLEELGWWSFKGSAQSQPPVGASAAAPPGRALSPSPHFSHLHGCECIYPRLRFLSPYCSTGRSTVFVAGRLSWCRRGCVYIWLPFSLCLIKERNGCVYIAAMRSWNCCKKHYFPLCVPAFLTLVYIWFGLSNGSKNGYNSS